VVPGPKARDRAESLGMPQFKIIEQPIKAQSEFKGHKKKA